MGQKKTSPKKPPVPGNRMETIRKAMTALLARERHSAKEISGALGISEK